MAKMSSFTVLPSNAPGNSRPLLLRHATNLAQPKRRPLAASDISISAELDDELREAVLGLIPTMVAFRLGPWMLNGSASSSPLTRSGLIWARQGRTLARPASTLPRAHGRPPAARDLASEIAGST